MSTIACLGEGCQFLPFTVGVSYEHTNIMLLFKELSTKDVFICNKHGSFHMCGNKQESPRCLPDNDGRCFVSGNLIKESVLSSDDFHYRELYSSNRSPSIQIKPEQAHADQVLSEKYTKFKFGQHIKDMMNSKDITVVADRLDSIMQRLYELFMDFKERDERRPQLNCKTVLENCDTRMDYLLAVLEQELRSANYYSNSDPGSNFRTQAALLVSHDMSCELAELMPKSHMFEAPAYLRKYEKILALRNGNPNCRGNSQKWKENTTDPSPSVCKRLHSDQQPVLCKNGSREREIGRTALFDAVQT